MKSKSELNLYLFTIILLVSLFLFEYWVYHSTLNPPATGCFFIVLFGLPCAVCGGSHAIRSLLHGQLLTAINFNILTTFILFFQVIITLVLLYDFIFSSDQFIRIYDFILRKLEKKIFRYGLALLLIGCWIVNIIKYHLK